MKSFCIAAIATLLGASPLALSQSRVLELAYEATSSDVRMPTSSAGELSLQGCPTCKVLRLRASEYTRYVIGDRQVSLAEMTRYLQGNPEASLVVLQHKDSLELSRLVVNLPTRAK